MVYNMPFTMTAMTPKGHAISQALVKARLDVREAAAPVISYAQLVFVLTCATMGIYYSRLAIATGFGTRARPTSSPAWGEVTISAPARVRGCDIVSFTSSSTYPILYTEAAVSVAVVVLRHAWSGSIQSKY